MPADEYNLPVVDIWPPFQVLMLPQGRYGIAYDLEIHYIQDLLPDGWGSHSSGVYKRLGVMLREAGYTRVQYSVWEKVSFPGWVFLDMLDLRRLRPRGILPTVVQELQMFSVPHAQVMVVSDHVRLGGMYSPGLTGVTPRERIPPGIPMQHVLPPGWPQNQNALPVGLRRTPEDPHLITAMVNDNWRVWH
ncbi:hypothetical protein OF83DRAFT_1174141 [Amylostereum chailletii]|nr:hypothetical protein OF83DRAFT_1174141 [Amylostereum chailletii]